MKISVFKVKQSQHFSILEEEKKKKKKKPVVFLDIKKNTGISFEVNVTRSARWKNREWLEKIYKICRTRLMCWSTLCLWYVLANHSSYSLMIVQCSLQIFSSYFNCQYFKNVSTRFISII